MVVDCNLASAAAAAESLDVPSALLFHSMFKTFSDVWFGELWPLLTGFVNDARQAFGLAPADSWNETFVGHDRLISVGAGCLRRTGPRRAGHRCATSASSCRSRRPSRRRRRLSRRRRTKGARQPLDHVSAAGRSARSRRRGAGRPRGARTRHDCGPRRRGQPRRTGARDGRATTSTTALVLPRTDALITHAGLGTVAAGAQPRRPDGLRPDRARPAPQRGRVAAVGAGIALESERARRRSATHWTRCSPTRAIDVLLRRWRRPVPEPAARQRSSTISSRSSPDRRFRGTPSR